jgi:2-polyprenyl-3-methyl-5-hydroxy-6-metoxy-1,4-benzoquinol methylase
VTKEWSGYSDDLRGEADAFNRRIEEREENGFIPDLQCLTRNDHFYKSFWRDPHYADLYVGEMARRFAEIFGRYLMPGARILDAGCGAGYFALELARLGYNVSGVDIAESAIRSAQNTCEAARNRGESLQLEYTVADPRELVAEHEGEYQGVLSAGFLHHIPLVEQQIDALANLLSPKGILVMHEPQHEHFGQGDAFWIASLRELLRITGHWYQEVKRDSTYARLRSLETEVFKEFVTERDPDELAGQSPNDLSADREEILRATKKHFEVIEDFPSRSFIYRTLGGLRGSPEQTTEIANFLEVIDAVAVDSGYLNANYFYAVARLM